MQHTQSKLDINQKTEFLPKFIIINFKKQKKKKKKKKISLSTNINTSFASQKLRQVHMKVFGRIKESKWSLSSKSVRMKRP